MDRDRIGSLSDQELGAALRAAIKRGGEGGVCLFVFTTNVRAAIGCPALYDDDRQSIPETQMHEFANVSNALVSLGHAPLRAVEVKREAESVSVADMLATFKFEERERH